MPVAAAAATSAFASPLSPVDATAAVATPAAISSPPLASELPKAASGSFVLNPLTFIFTKPPPDIFYLVREDQLDNLAAGGSDLSLEIALAAAGGAIGFLQNFLTTLTAVFNNKSGDRVNDLLAAVFLGLTVLS